MGSTKPESLTLKQIKQKLSKPIKAMLRPVLVRNPMLREVLHVKGLIARPTLPYEVGMSYYQLTSSWGLQPEVCPCDLQFCEYLQQTGTMGKSIFHFGTGSHHIIGLENQKLDCPNEVMGITASLPEHQAYAELVLQDAALAKYYKVLFADIYTLTDSNLPSLDIINLFHLCEFYNSDNAALIHHNDESLLQLFLDKLKADGKILFYNGSLAWERSTRALVQSFEETGKINRVGEYKNLLIYAQGPV